MIFEHLHFDFNLEQPLRLSVGADVFSGAQIEWGKFVGGDRAWFIELLEGCVRCWEPDDAPPHGEWRFTGLFLDPDATEIRYQLAHLDAGMWREAPEWSTLSDEQRATILEKLAECLAMINGHLII